MTSPWLSNSASVNLIYNPLGINLTLQYSQTLRKCYWAFDPPVKEQDIIAASFYRIGGAIFKLGVNDIQS